MRPRVWAGELLRWYLTRAKHPFKGYLVGHYWGLFCKPRLWVSYDETSVINVCLGEYIQQRIFFDRYYEQPLIDWIKQTLRESDVFWDVGANIGAVTLVAARRCRQVVAFEPDPRSVEHLARNLRINEIENVEVVPAALDDSSGTTVLRQATEANTGLSSITSGSTEGVRELLVQTARVDDFLDAHPTLAPTVMKIDVEGAEHRVLGGAARLLQNGRLRALVFEDRTGANGKPSNLTLLARLDAAGYQVQPLGASAENVGDGMFNYLATPARVEALGA